MVAAIALSKKKNQAGSTSGFNKEDIVPPTERGIASMSATTVTKNENNPSQKNDRGDPLSGIAAT